MMRTDYQLKKTFEGYYKILQIIKATSVYPNVLSEFNNYQEQISKSSNVPKINRMDDQFYEIPINTILGDYYHLNWNATKLEEYANNNISLAQDVPIGHPLIYNDTIHLKAHTLNYLSKESIRTPIILGYHTALRRLFILDGNHRYNAAMKRGDKTIKAITLSPHIHVEYMLNDLSKTLFKVHHNLSVLLNLNIFRKTLINESLLPNTFYPLTNNMFNFSRIKNVLIHYNKIQKRTQLKNMFT